LLATRPRISSQAVKEISPRECYAIPLADRIKNVAHCRFLAPDFTMVMLQGERRGETKAREGDDPGEGKRYRISIYRREAWLFRGDYANGDSWRVPAVVEIFERDHSMISRIETRATKILPTIFLFW
jgi:hypothetical protein